MARVFNWGNDDWYITVSYIFAGDDEITLPKEDIISVFRNYYNKFRSTITSPIIPKNIVSMFPKSLANEMFESNKQIRISNETYLSKRELFEKLLKSFKMSEQYEIINRLFDKGAYIDDDYDTKYLQIYIGNSAGSEYEKGLMQRYEQLLKSKQHNIDAKRDILVNLLRNLEPLECDIKKVVGSKKSSLIFSMGNNLHIRHNNKEGENKHNIIVNMSNEKLSLIYDDLYMLIKIVFNLIRDKDFYRHYDERDRIINEFENINKELKKEKKGQRK
ncbi:MAG: hypothetical protein LBU73_07870 [Helicobacteraceae bacterium]|jgi:sulfur relay (sulfurtransferase) DsrC/TusE family protein|nr:hypothetical protein [Helicobacteraceae bacterium]